MEECGCLFSRNPSRAPISCIEEGKLLDSYCQLESRWQGGSMNFSHETPGTVAAHKANKDGG
jgi:hypothetical protein